MNKLHFPPLSTRLTQLPTHHAQLKRDNRGHNAANADEWPTLLDAVNLSDCPILDLDNLSGKIGNEAYAKFMDLE